jgi:hypothetical protein
MEGQRIEKGWVLKHHNISIFLFSVGTAESMTALEMDHK